MQLSEFITRIKDNCPLLKGRVFGAAELAIATPTTMQPPCAFVIAMSEKADGNSLLGGFSQRITAQIGVVIAIRNFSDTRGEGSHKQLELVRTELFNALCAWQAPSTDIPTSFYAGQLASYDNMMLRWSDVFETQFYYRK